MNKEKIATSLVTKVSDYSVDYSNKYTSNILYSNIFNTNYSLSEIIMKVKKQLYKLIYTLMYDINDDQIYFLSFITPMYCSGIVKIIDYNKMIETSMTTTATINTTSTEITESNKYIIVFEYDNGSKNYMYRIFSWLLLFMSNNDDELSEYCNPQIIEKTYNISDTNLIVLFDRLLSNDIMYIKTSITDISKIMYNNSIHDELIKHGIFQIYLDIICKYYDNFTKYWNYLLSIVTTLYYISIKNNLLEYKTFILIKQEHIKYLKHIINNTTVNFLNQKLFLSACQCIIDTMNLSKLDVDEELLSGTLVKENT